ncbi:MAG: mannitol-1-phosphate 5-dehydrogenase, partial [Ignavibacteria bacterium]|nr:mannitol-1-phosphate 5-dehydrogenase [Ignavibacteria bacterium]
MKALKQDKIVIFGAGKIGRSFIGQLFGCGGYEVVFIDVYKQIIDELNVRRNYNVIIKSEKEEIINITSVRGVFADDGPSVAFEIATARLVAVSVGLHGLNKIFPLLANGLLERYAIDDGLALDIIIAENMRNSDTFFREELMKLVPPDYPFERLVGLVETSIGKMVPIMQKN